MTNTIHRGPVGRCDPWAGLVERALLAAACSASAACAAARPPEQGARRCVERTPEETEGEQEGLHVHKMTQQGHGGYQDVDGRRLLVRVGLLHRVEGSEHIRPDRVRGTAHGRGCVRDAWIGHRQIPLRGCFSALAHGGCIHLRKRPRGHAGRSCERTRRRRYADQ
jgi:hypothetical protein